MRILEQIVQRYYPDFDDTLKKAGMHQNAVQYVSKGLMMALLFSFIIIVPFFFGFLKAGKPLVSLALIYLLVFCFIFWVVMLMPKMSMRRRKKEIESDLIYSLRHLLLKLQCGGSLLNSFASVAKLPTISSKYFAEIMTDINMGIPIEEAVDYALKYSPSDEFKTVMDEIKNSLKTGTNLQETLNITLKEMTNQKIIEIENYGKKLNPITMFYMLIGTIIPSIGSAAFVIGATFTGVGETFSTFLLYVMGGFLIIVQVFFYLIFKAMKPIAEF